MTITTLPTPPGPTDDVATFNARAFALLGALPTFVTETNAAAVDIDAARRDQPLHRQIHLHSKS